MASIRKRNGRYQVQIRKGAHPLISRTFARLGDAKKWVSTAEYQIEHGLYEASPPPLTSGKMGIENDQSSSFNLGLFNRLNIYVVPNSGFF